MTSTPVNANALAEHQNGTLTRRYMGADDGIRTHDPHLGNVKRTVRALRPSALTWSPVRLFVRPVRPVRPFRIPVYHCPGQRNRLLATDHTDTTMA